MNKDPNEMYESLLKKNIDLFQRIAGFESYLSKSGASEFNLSELVINDITTSIGRAEQNATIKFLFTFNGVTHEGNKIYPVLSGNATADVKNNNVSFRDIHIDYEEVNKTNATDKSIEEESILVTEDGSPLVTEDGSHIKLTGNSQESLKEYSLPTEESQIVEFVREWTPECLKAICSFANTDGGELYIGVDDHGSILGICHFAV